MTAETLRNFDPAALTLSWNNRRWQLVHHNEVLKDFGSREHDARLAELNCPERAIDIEEA